MAPLHELLTGAVSRLDQVEQRLQRTTESPAERAAVDLGRRHACTRKGEQRFEAVEVELAEFWSRSPYAAHVPWSQVRPLARQGWDDSIASSSGVGNTKR